MSNNTMTFFYRISSGSIPASGSIVTTLTLQSDSKFRLDYIYGRSTSEQLNSNWPLSNSGAGPSGGVITQVHYPNWFEVQIQNQSTGRYLSNLRIPQALICAPSDQVAPERMSEIFDETTVLQFDFLNLDPNNANTVDLVLKGYKLFL